MVVIAVSTASLAQAPGGGTVFPPGGARSLPSLGDNSDLSPAAERRIGDRIAASIHRDPDLVEDPVLADYLQGIWQPLMAAARARRAVGRTGRALCLGAVPDPRPQHQRLCPAWRLCRRALGFDQHCQQRR